MRFLVTIKNTTVSYSTEEVELDVDDIDDALLEAQGEYEEEYEEEEYCRYTEVIKVEFADEEDYD